MTEWQVDLWCPEGHKTVSRVTLSGRLTDLGDCRQCEYQRRLDEAREKNRLRNPLFQWRAQRRFRKELKDEGRVHKWLQK